MPELLEIQQAFAGLIRDPQRRPADGAPWLIGDASLVERRLGIYRANVAAATAKALGAAYPVIRQLVGDDFFDGLARDYRRAFPSTSGDLFDYGGAFSAFLRAFTPARSLAYLPDLARLEWHAQRAYGARDAEAFDVARLGEVPSDRQADLCFEWADGTAVVASPFPIVQLWQIHQTGFAGAFEVDWTAGENACVARDGFQVVVTSLTDADAAFTAASVEGRTLAAACDAALATDPAFDPGPLLSRAIAARLISGFRVGPQEKKP